MKATILINNQTLELSGEPNEITATLKELLAAPEPKKPGFPETVEECLLLAIEVGYRDISIEDFSSINKLVVSRPKFIASLGSFETFKKWYLCLNSKGTFTRGTTVLKHSSLERYYNSCKGS